MRRSLILLFLLIQAAPVLATEALKPDTRQPIEISADKLEVLQSTQQAVFTGHVEAVQGQTTLRADKMTVFYHKAGEGGQAAPAAQGAVSRIEVDGNVEIVTPTESGTGDKGAYNVDAKQVTLFGNVSLHKDKNVLKGERLEYNVATGRSLLTSSGGSKVSGEASSGGRVKGVFVPQGGEVLPAAPKQPGK